MPDIKLKEAIWYLEAFFNIGVCQKQSYYADVMDLTKTYLFTVPFLDEDNGMFLLWAFCNLVKDENTHEVRHEWGVEKICQYSILASWSSNVYAVKDAPTPVIM